MGANEVIEILAVSGLGGLIVLSIVLYLINNLHVVIKAAEFLARGAYRLRLADKRMTVGRELEGRLNQFCLRLQREMPTVVTKSLRISWIKDGNQFADLQDGQVILYIRDNANTSESLADTTMLFLSRGVINESRPFIERTLVESIDIALAQRFLSTDLQALESLHDNYIGPHLTSQARRRFLELATTLDDHGVLTRIVLSEFGSLALRLAGKASSTRGRAETVRFAEFVERVVTRDQDEVPLRFQGRLFNSTIALIARSENRDWEGKKLYRRKFLHDIESGVRVIHLLGRGPTNVALVNQLAGWAIESKLVNDIISRQFVDFADDGTRVPAICITCVSARATGFLELSPVDEMYSALYEIVPETLDGKIEIVAIAREPNVRAKVVVRSSRAFDPLRRCLGTRNENIEALQTRLAASQETIDFIVWESDPLKLIAKALYPLRESEILNIDVDVENAEAKIALTTTEYMGPIIGKDGVNVRLAQRVTGFAITFADSHKIARSAVAADVISDNVEPISEGEIKIRGIGRQNGLTKVFVSSDLYSDPRRECTDRADWKTLRKLLSGDLIRFIEWHESVESRIRNALEPVHPTEIISCNVNDEAKTALVKVLTVQAAKQATGKRRKNLKAANELTGYDITIRVDDSGLD